MKYLYVAIAILFTGMVNAQDFDFGCAPCGTVETTTGTYYDHSHNNGFYIRFQVSTGGRAVVEKYAMDGIVTFGYGEQVWTSSRIESAHAADVWVDGDQPSGLTTSETYTFKFGDIKCKN